MPNTSSNWRLSEQAVDRTKQHIELRFGDASSFPYMDAERTAERQRKGCESRGEIREPEGVQEDGERGLSGSAIDFW